MGQISPAKPSASSRTKKNENMASTEQTTRLGGEGNIRDVHAERAQ